MIRSLLASAALLAMFSQPVSPQDALVVELTREESAKAAELYNRLTAADKEWRAFKAGIQSKYGPTLVRDVAEGGKLYHEGIPMPAEWMNGVAFSKDFRFAVPAKAPR